MTTEHLRPVLEDGRGLRLLGEAGESGSTCRGDASCARRQVDRIGQTRRGGPRNGHQRRDQKVVKAAVAATAHTNMPFQQGQDVNLWRLHCRD